MTNLPLCPDAVILAGGLGTRLRPVLPDTQKVLAPVDQRPFLAYLLDQLHLAGCRRAVLALGYRAEQAELLLAGDQWPGMECIASVEASPLGTGGALRQAVDRIHSDTVMAMNGDSLCDLDFPALLAFHRQKRPAATLALAQVAEAGRYGRIEVTPDGLITRFLEKEPGPGGIVNAGVYLFEREYLLPLPQNTPLSLERDLFPDWAARGQLGGALCVSRFLDIGTPDSLAQAPDFVRAMGRPKE